MNKNLEKLRDELAKGYIESFPEGDKDDFDYMLGNLTGFKEGFNACNTEWEKRVKVLVEALDKIAYFGHLESSAIADHANEALKRFREE